MLAYEVSMSRVRQVRELFLNPAGAIRVDVDGNQTGPQVLRVQSYLKLMAEKLGFMQPWLRRIPNFIFNLWAKHNKSL